MEKAKAIKLGAYNEPGAEQGPQVDDIQFKRVMGYIEKGKAEGATVALGGDRHGSKGYFVQPTVFTGKKPNCVFLSAFLHLNLFVVVQKILVVSNFHNLSFFFFCRRQR